VSQPGLHAVPFEKGEIRSHHVQLRISPQIVIQNAMLVSVVVVAGGTPAIGFFEVFWELADRRV